MGNQDSHLMIINKSKTNCTTSVRDCDRYDWKNGESPSQVFNGVQIRAGQSECKRLCMNGKARNCPFTMTLKFSNGLQDTFRLKQKYAVNKGWHDFHHSQKSHEISIGKSGTTVKLTIETSMQEIENLARNEMKKKRYDEAMKIINEFMQSLKVGDSKRTHLQEVKAEVFYNQGKDKVEESVRLEKECSQTEAKNALNQSKLKLVEACKLSKKQEYKKLCDFVSFKIQGLDTLDDGLKLHETANDLFEKAQNSKNHSDFAIAQAKYKEALGKFVAAVKVFEKAAANNGIYIGDKLALAKQQRAVTIDTIGDLDNAELTFETGTANQKKGQIDDTKIHQQI